ncbi:hypothetical protein G5B46_06800 [Caulobacter sp. 602-2]|uniref:DUF883 family protein n=1 Tax=Caulobacter sp. 602-2 TaxID=2710887 RepID=A0A6G4QUL3_9CAUL|nr:hypothetical protein [Caulobacter sp. 602-2]NGM49310.1 hypothetical protein [Caulobacter sp. 602-2]
MTDIPTAPTARHRATAKAKLDSAAVDARHAYDNLKDGAQELYAGGREHFDSARLVAEEKLREKPLLAVSAAVGVGILLGLLLRGPRTVYVRVPG